MSETVEDIYKFDQETVQQLKRSKVQQGYLLPVVKDQHGKIVSGRHRKLADKNWREETINVKDELDREVKIIHYNVQRRPSQKETAGRLLHIAKILEKQGVPDDEVLHRIVELVPYSLRWIQHLLPDKYKEVESTHFLVPQLYNVWSFGKYDERFGIENFEGRIPGQIVQNTLYYYSEEGDLIVDPMAGSGTTIDVCKLMKRHVLAYDINPVRGDIAKHDIRQGYPKECKNCDLIFLDPPYFNMVFDNFQSIDEFYTFIEKLALSSHETVKNEGVIALLMQDMTEKGNYCLSGECYRIFRKVGFEAVAHVSCPLTTQQFLPQQVEKAKEDKHLLGRNRDLYIFKKV